MTDRYFFKDTLNVIFNDNIFGSELTNINLGDIGVYQDAIILHSADQTIQLWIEKFDGQLLLRNGDVTIIRQQNLVIRHRCTAMYNY